MLGAILRLHYPKDDLVLRLHDNLGRTGFSFAVEPHGDLAVYPDAAFAFGIEIAGVDGVGICEEDGVRHGAFVFARHVIDDLLFNGVAAGGCGIAGVAYAYGEVVTIMVAHTLAFPYIDRRSGRGDGAQAEQAGYYDKSKLKRFKVGHRISPLKS